MFHITPSKMENQNTPKYLEKQKITLYEVLRHIQPAPSVQYSTLVPRDMEIETPETDPDIRISQHEMDKERVDDKEFYSDDKDQDRGSVVTQNLLSPTLSISSSASIATNSISANPISANPISNTLSNITNLTITTPTLQPSVQSTTIGLNSLTNNSNNTSTSVISSNKL